MIREVTWDELPLCEPHARAFYNSRKHVLRGTFSMDKFLSYWRNIYTFERGIILGSWQDDALKGGFGLIIVDGPYDEIRRAIEQFWWLPNGGRDVIRVVKEAEFWAKAHGAQINDLAHFIDTPKIGEWYQRQDYAPIETHYEKVL